VVRAIVTLLGTAAVATSLYLVLRFRDTQRTLPEPLPAETGNWPRLAVSAGRVTGMVTAAIVAGVLVLGWGGRLMMRLLAATSRDSVQGRITDAEAIVGEVTVDGTIGLAVFIGLFGGMVSLGLFVVLRRWLPQRSVLAGLLAAAIGAGGFARPSDLLNPDNRDFSMLSPSWLAVAMAITIIVLFGLTFAVLVDRWANTWHRPDRSWKGIAPLLPLIALIVFPPMLVLAIAGMGISAFIAPKTSGLRWLGPVDVVLRIVVAVIAMLGAISASVAAVEILTL
jgi:hypothetical protein